MNRDIPTQYAQLGDEELLQIAADRGSLGHEATVALDAEMQRRGLSRKDVSAHEHFVQQSSKREVRQRRRRMFGRKQDKRFDWNEWITAICAFAGIGLVTWGYQALPYRFRFSGDWEMAAAPVVWSSIFLIAFAREWWKKPGFWVVLTVSSTLHLLLAHHYLKRLGDISRESVFLGIALFFAVAFCGFFLRRRVYGINPDEDDLEQS